MLYGPIYSKRVDYKNYIKQMFIFKLKSYIVETTFNLFFLLKLESLFYYLERFDKYYLKKVLHICPCLEAVAKSNYRL